MSNINPCEICGTPASLMGENNIPEGQNCSKCGQWFCNDCENSLFLECDSGCINCFPRKIEKEIST